MVQIATRELRRDEMPIPARWLFALLIPTVMLLSACFGDNDQDEGEAPDARDNRVSMLSDVSRHLTNRYELDVTADVELLEIRIPSRDAAVLLQAASEEGGDECLRQGTGELVCEREDVEEGVWEITVTHAGADRDTDIRYEIIAEAEPEEVALELEIVDPHRDLYGLPEAGTPQAVVEERFARSARLLDLVDGALARARALEEGRYSYGVEGPEEQLAQVTMIVEKMAEQRELRLYVRQELPERVLLATETDAPINLNASGRVERGRMWSFAAGGFSTVRLGDRTGTDAVIQLVTEPTPRVEERGRESADPEWTWRRR